MADSLFDKGDAVNIVFRQRRGIEFGNPFLVGKRRLCSTCERVTVWWIVITIYSHYVDNDAACTVCGLREIKGDPVNEAEESASLAQNS